MEQIFKIMRFRNRLTSGWIFFDETISLVFNSQVVASSINLWLFGCFGLDTLCSQLHIKQTSENTTKISKALCNLPLMAHGYEGNSHKFPVLFT